jgi:hypothetical protein
LKAERSRLKARFLKGADDAPFKVDPDQWDRLKAYWRTDAQKEKAGKMAAARQGVKSGQLVGRRGKAGKDAEVVSAVTRVGFHDFA